MLRLGPLPWHTHPSGCCAPCSPSQANLFVAVLFSKFARAQQLYYAASAAQQRGALQGLEDGRPRSCLLRLWGWAAGGLRALTRPQAWQGGRVSPELPGAAAPRVRLRTRTLLAGGCPALPWRPCCMCLCNFPGQQRALGEVWHLQGVPRWRQRLLCLVEHPAFGYFFLLCVLGNTAVLASYRAGGARAAGACFSAAWWAS